MRFDAIVFQLIFRGVSRFEPVVVVPVRSFIFFWPVYRNRFNNILRLEGGLSLSVGPLRPGALMVGGGRNSDVFVGVVEECLY